MENFGLFVTGILAVVAIVLIVKQVYFSESNSSLCPATPSRGPTTLFAPSLEDKLRDYLFNTYQNYACSDARAYSQCINASQKNIVLTRYERIPLSTRNFENEANQTSQPNPMTGLYSSFQVKKVADLLDKAKSGCCTTLALSAAHKLSTEFPDLRIEIASSRVVRGRTAHCFLIVNRDSTHTNGWGFDALIVDPWLITLGHNNGVFKPHEYKTVSLEGLTLRYDRQAQPSFAPGVLHQFPQSQTPWSSTQASASTTTPWSTSRRGPQ